MRILWVEDILEDNSIKKHFGVLNIGLHEVKPINNFDEAYKIISGQHQKLDLEKFDFVVLDIDLSESEFEEHAEKLSSRFELGKSEFREIAGFDLFVQLMEQGFPKERIIFFTANASPRLEERKIIIKEMITAFHAKDHVTLKDLIPKLETAYEGINVGLEETIASKQWLPFLLKLEKKEEESSTSQTENVYKRVADQFLKARIEVPNAESKFNTAGFDEWLRQNCERSEQNKATHDYLTLRRGILNVMDELTGSKTPLTDDFRDDLDKSAFLEGLRWLLQAHDMRPERAGQFYLTLCDTLTKPFERFKLWELIPRAVPNRSCRIPAYFLRNWISHGLISGSDNTPDLSALDAGFTFLIVMQSLFGQEMYGHGDELIQLFGIISAYDKTIRDQVVTLQKRIYSSPNKAEKLEEINDKGQKKKNSDWHEENFLLHFYASYLLASTKLVPYKEATTGKERREKRAVVSNRVYLDRYAVYLNYELQQTPFLGIASVMWDKQYKITHP